MSREDLEKLKSEMEKAQDPKKAEKLLSFFQAGKGGYGEGDKFLGIKVPDQRKLAKKYYKLLSLGDVSILLKNKIHEHRLTGAFILVYKFEKAKDADEKREIYEFYIRNRSAMNNWDIVDTTTPNVVGAYLFDRDRSILFKLAKSDNIWEKRMAMLATYYFIKRNDFDDALKIAEILLHDEHDLIHKAVGWMLREIGNRNMETEEQFLKKYYRKMPRTMLRYAIEKFPEEKRRFYLGK